LILKSGGARVSNREAAVFVSSIRFSWAFDLPEIWTRDIRTGLYSFSSLFDERFKDISSWMMSPPFFDQVPELIGYIRMHDPAPGNALIPDCSIDARRNAESNGKNSGRVGECLDFKNNFNCDS